jgi:hypothetical protein
MFDVASIRVETMREEEEYQGLRVRLNAKLANAVIPIQVDIGFGDVVHPAPMSLDYPTLLDDMPAAKIRAYPPETVIAEKFEAMARFGDLTSRLKDHYDIWALSRTFPFEMQTLATAIIKTFKQRATAMPTATPSPLTEAFAADLTKQAQWTAFVRRAAPTLGPPPFSDLLAELRGFLEPVLMVISSESPKNERWLPAEGWTK